MRVCSAVLIVLLAACAHNESTRALIRDDRHFGNAAQSGATFAALGQRILDDARSCADRHGKDDRRCQALFSAAAWTNVAAPILVNCSGGGVDAARRGLDADLAAIARFVPGRDPMPTIPPLPTC